MSTALEQLIKMHDPRCVSIEALNIGRVRTTLSQEQILGAFASCQHRHPVGFDLLMSKYRHDCKAEQRVRAAISAWLHKRPHPPRAIAACQLSLNMVLERNLPAQTQLIATLLLRYGARTKMSRKVVEDLKQKIKQLERNKAQTLNDEMIASLGKQITALQSKIRTLRGALRAWAIQEAARTQVCPRCRGAGKTLRPHPELCNECGGHGRFDTTLEDLRKSLGCIGPEVGAADWAAHYAPLVKECLQWLYSEESIACEVLTNRIRLERSLDAQ
ncbi:TPA: hypothetical protein PXS19_002485 [Yersinia enterocolitica]|nr:hypothetical protein [Yersinia enterocolitica]HDL8531868.1 hypothetical protein [Yersinia enterocolitica]HDL8551862.1 hypothetical protein [Yersinia enterocolitica]HDL8560548.1 hypothetical protein [Yersinia enterocolitica]